MKRTVTYNSVFQIQRALHKLYDSGAKFRVDAAVNLTKVMCDVDELADAITDQLVEAIPGLKDMEYVMNESERELYSAILSSAVEIDNRDVDLGGMSMDDSARIDLETANILLSIF